MKEELKKLFFIFYKKLLEDPHASRFILSQNLIDDLIERQSTVLEKLIQAIKSDNKEEVEKISKQIAEVHKKLDLKIDVFNKFMEYYLFLVEKHNLDINDVEKDFLKDSLMKHYTEKYIQNQINNVLKILENVRKSEKNFYKNYIVSKKIHFLNQVASIVESFDSYKLDPSLTNHSICPVGKFFSGIGFKIMTINNVESALRIQAFHREVHTSFLEFLSYYKDKNYIMSARFIERLIKNLLNMTTELNELFYNWDKDHKEIVASYLSSYQSKEDLYMLIIQYKDKAFMDYYLKHSPNSPLKFIEDFDFIFIYEREDNNIELFFNKKAKGFQEKFKDILNKIQDVNNVLKLQSENRSIAKIIKLDLSSFPFLTEEEVLDLDFIIRKHADMEKVSEPIAVLDYTPKIYDLLVEVRQFKKLEKLIREKISKKDTDIFIHKIFNYKKQVIAAEILARIKDEEGNYIPAYKFIDVIKEKGLTRDFDLSILHNVKRNISLIKKFTDRIFINLFPSSFSDDKVVEEIKNLVKESKKHKVFIYFEITEHEVATKEDILLLIKSGDINVVFDDFGTGYTNFELIGDLSQNNKAKAVKIDGSIVKNMLSNPNYKSIVKSITLFTTEINLECIYEFIENENVFNQIIQMAEDLKIDKSKLGFQGFWLHKPTNILEEVES